MAFVEVTFAEPVMVVPFASPVVLTSTLGSSSLPPASVPMLQVAMFAPDEVQVVPVSDMPVRS